jgi:uncharacterized protein GlcG (DUF336 family)
MSYGPSITREDAKTVAAAALTEAAANQWTMAVAIVDPHGDLVYFEKMDDTPLGSTTVCQDKARSAARFKRSTKVFQDMLAGGGEGLRVLGIKGAVPVEGGLPILRSGTVIGAVGLSGGTSPQDGQCAQAGLAALS